MKLYLTKYEEYFYILSYNYSEDKISYEKYKIETLSNGGKIYLYNNAKNYDLAIDIKKDLEKMLNKKLKLVEININITLKEVC